MPYYLMKSEPSEYSIDDLKRDKSSSWYGVRNYQARNFMKEMKVGDKILFYHSSCDVVGVAGTAEVVAPAHADETQFDPKGDYYEPKSTREKYLWECVDVGFVEKFKDVVKLSDIRANPKLANMRILQKGNRLSVTPLVQEEFDEILRMSNGK